MAAERLPSIADDLLTRLPASPDAYPQKIDVNSWMVLFIQFDAGAYRLASFLDDRLLGPATKGGWLAVDRVVDAARLVTNVRPAHFIFHTGHVGSTLVRDRKSTRLNSSHGYIS